MEKHSYKIEYLPSFDKELDDILYYITYKLKNKKAAERLLDKVNHAIIARSITPGEFGSYQSMKNRKYNWFRIYVGNYTIFYTLINDIMRIAHILYSRRNIEKLIGDEYYE